MNPAPPVTKAVTGPDYPVEAAGVKPLDDELPAKFSRQDCQLWPAYCLHRKRRGIRREAESGKTPASDNGIGTTNWEYNRQAWRVLKDAFFLRVKVPSG